MIAISKDGKDSPEQPRMRVHDVNRMARVRFGSAENNRFCRFPSAGHPTRENVEIISERRQIRADVSHIPTNHHAQDRGAVYRHTYQISACRPHVRAETRPFRRTHTTSHPSWQTRSQGVPVHRVTSIDRDGTAWTSRRSPVPMKPVPVSARYWGWKDHHPEPQRQAPPSHVPSVEKPSPRAVTVTVSHDESPISEASQTNRQVLGPTDPTDPTKRQLSPSVNPSFKRQKGLDRLNILVRASLEMGPMQLNPTGCSCPKSKCVALYCECFKAGRRCDPKTCTCANCKNTLDESGPSGARTLAIRSILARNPRAFLTAGTNQNQAQKLAPGEVACNCLRSRCLKLYCTCFQQKKTCKEGICSCVGCLNTDEDVGGERKHAIESTLEKRPDAFETRTKQVGLGCACKNNRCIRKYCECFRNGLACRGRCSCNHCENKTDGANQNEDANPAVADSVAEV